MAVASHVHISGISAFIQALYVIAVFGALSALAKRFEGHPLADAWLELF